MMLGRGESHKLARLYLSTSRQIRSGQKWISQQLAERLNVRDQAMSQQLSILRAKGFVKTRRDGQTIYYSLAREDIRRIIETLYEQFCVQSRPPPRRKPLKA